MKKQLTIFIILLSFVVFGQNDSTNNANIEKRIQKLEKEMDTIKQDETSMYNLKRDILITRAYQEEIYKDWVTKWGETAFLFFALVGGVIGFLGLKKAITIQVVKKLSEITGKSLEDIKQNYEQYVKHNALKKDSKVLVLNEKDTVFPAGFTKVVELFGIDLKSTNNLIEVKGLDEALSKENIRKMKNADVVIIENQENKINGKADSSHWNLGDLRNISEIEEIADKAEKENQQEYNNIYNLIKLANEICDTTAIIYYGQQGKGFFPSEFVSPDKQHLITFANAPSQLYGNLLNMLKFLSEINQ